MKKTWTYIPQAQNSNPRISTVNATRARIEAGGAYFRSVKLGNDANFISIQTVGNFLVCHDVTNSTTSPNVSILKCNLNWNEHLRFDGTSIFLDLVDTVGNVTQSNQLATSNKISNSNFKLEFNTQHTLTPNVRMYQLIPQTVIDMDTNAQISGFNLIALQQTVMDDASRIIEIPARVGGVSWDVQAEGTDAPILSPFGRTLLKGGSGLPSAPNSFNTGPSRTLAHLNYSENYDGSMGTVNKMYEWRGSSETNGSWELY